MIAQTRAHELSSRQNYMKIKSANGMTGCLIYCGDGNYRIRIYDNDAGDVASAPTFNLPTFVDYDIAHNDLVFRIEDEDAYLYEDDSGPELRAWIDHAPPEEDSSEEQLCPTCGESWSGTSCGLNDCGWVTGKQL